MHDIEDRSTDNLGQRIALRDHIEDIHRLTLWETFWWSITHYKLRQLTEIHNHLHSKGR